MKNYIKRIEDFTFAPFNSQIEYGDSGPLLIATPRNGKNPQYIIKHSYSDCAANEFVYTRLAQAMDLKMPDVVLFQGSDSHIRQKFQSKYIMGSMYVPIKIEKPTYQQIRNEAKNWQDYFRFLAMYTMLNESDSFETPLSTDGFVYRIDTSAAFGLDKSFISAASMPPFQNMIREYILGLDYNKSWEERNYMGRLQHCIELYGEESKSIFLEPFCRIIELSPAYVNDILNTLCIIYPDIIGDYYKQFIEGIQKQAALFIKHVK